MKYSLLLSVAAATSLHMGAASAQVIPPMGASADECHNWAEAQEDPTYRAHAGKRCRAIVNCMRDQSDNDNNLRECLFAAESDFQRATSTGLPQGPEMGVETPAATEVADSAYDHPDRGKGWEFTDQGD